MEEGEGEEEGGEERDVLGEGSSGAAAGGLDLVLMPCWDTDALVGGTDAELVGELVGWPSAYLWDVWAVCSLHHPGMQGCVRLGER